MKLCFYYENLLLLLVKKEYWNVLLVYNLKLI